MTATHFNSAAEFRRWLAAHHATAAELLVHFYKKNSGRGGLSYAEAVDEVLCYSWIDGVRKSLDAQSYTIRFTPRKTGSIWSLVNVRHVERLTAAGRMRAAGRAAFAARSAQKTGVYSFERPVQKLPAEMEQRFRANEPAWAFFTAQAPWYQRVAIHKVVSPKQAATRERWFNRLVADCSAQRRLAAIAGPTPPKSA